MVGKWGRACHLSHIKPTYTYWLCSWEIRLVSSNLGPLVPHYLMIRNWGNEPDPRLSCVMFGVGGSAGDGGRMTGRWDRASQSASQSVSLVNRKRPNHLSQCPSSPPHLARSSSLLAKQKYRKLIIMAGFTAVIYTLLTNCNLVDSQIWLIKPHITGEYSLNQNNSIALNILWYIQPTQGCF